MKRLKKQIKGITLITLVVTIIVLLILAGVVISLTIGNNGLFTRAKMGTKEHIKQEATEAMNLKITGIQIESYTESQTLPSLQYLADKLCEDNEMEYVLKKGKKQANLNKIDVSDVKSIFTKIKKYPYEFEIDSGLKLASINGVKIAENNSENDDLRATVEEMKIAIESLQEENKNLKSRLQTLEDETIVNKRVNLMNTIKEIPLSYKTGSQLNIDIPLSSSIKEYKYIEIDYDVHRNVVTTDGGLFESTIFISTNEIEFYDSNTINWDNNSTFGISVNVNGSVTEGAASALWAKNDTTLHVGRSYSNKSDWDKIRIKNIYGIK